MSFKEGDIVVYIGRPGMSSVWRKIQYKMTGKIIGPYDDLEFNSRVEILSNPPNGYNIGAVVTLQNKSLKLNDDTDIENLKYSELINKINTMWTRQNYYKKHYGKSNHKTLK